MKFHADKCKVLSVANSAPLFVDVLPFSRYLYQLGNTILYYTNCERDLGIFVNERFKWQDHQTYILKKASEMFGMTKRTCHFVYDKGKKRSLYLALVRSYFEHCSCVWRPVNSTDITKFESLQRRAMKWINNEEGCRYTDEFYELRTDILPLKQHFDLNDILLFHKIVYNLIPVTMPSYIYPYHGASKLRISHLDWFPFNWPKNDLKLRRNIKKNSSGCNARLALNTNTDSISTKSERNHEIDVIKTAVRQV